MRMFYLLIVRVRKNNYMCMAKKCQCGMAKLCSWLVVIGGLNWGLVGLGMLFSSMHDMSWNVVHMILGSWPVVEGIVYLIVGVATVMTLVGCKCAKCKACMAGRMDKGAMGGNMGGGMAPKM